MRIGLHIGKFDWDGGPQRLSPKLAEIARTADQAGFYSLWVMDHLFQLGEVYGVVHGPVEASMLEGYTTVAYLAGLTQHIKLGVMVTCAFFRPPGLLVKTASTIDVLSGGRTYFGIGAGWFEREATGLGIPLPTWKERYERLEETLQIARLMWSGQTRPYEGRYYQLAEPLNNPQPLSRPHPPIMIGGEGEKKTLRLVAQYADASNFVIGAPVEEFGVLNTPYEDQYGFLRRKLEVLQQHCRDCGRPFAEIEKTVVTYAKLAPGAQTPEEILQLCHDLGAMGFEHIIFNLPNVDEIEPLEVFGRKIIPALGM
jgi:F420-dependent oxidoreductase-like protein